MVRRYLGYAFEGRIESARAAVPPDNNAQGLYQYIGSLTRPVRYCPGTGSHTLKVSTPWLPPGVLQSAANLSKL